MQEENQKQEVAIIEQLPSVAVTMQQTYQASLARAERGVLALSKIKAVTNDQEDKIANDMLVKARCTIEGGQDAEGKPIPGIKKTRLDDTRKLDELKAFLMMPEKMLIEEAERVSKLRNKYATEKAERIRIENERIAKEKARNDEIARVKAALRSQVVEGVVAAVEKMNESIREFMGNITLETFESAAKRFKIKPQLRNDVYESFFTTSYNAELISNEMFKAIQEDIKKESPYQAVNEKYVSIAQKIVDDWASQLPAKKADLERIAELEKTNHIEAERERERQREEEEKRKREHDEKMKREADERQAEIDRKKNEENLQNDFNAQVQAQSGEQLTGVRQGRIALLDCKPEDIVITLSNILLACYSNPKFSGHLKRDRKGAVVPPDENGNPVYAAWLQPLLNFVADEADKPIPGVIFKAKVSAINKA